MNAQYLLFSREWVVLIGLIPDGRMSGHCLVLIQSFAWILDEKQFPLLNVFYIYEIKQEEGWKTINTINKQNH